MDKWYNPEHKSGWKSKDNQDKRRRIVLRSSKGDPLKAGRRLQALANVQKNNNPEVARKARADALYFFRLNEQKKKSKRA